MGTELDLVMRELQEAKSFWADKVAAGIAPLKEEQARVAATVEKALRDIAELRKLQVLRSAESGQVRVPGGRLAGYTYLDLRIIEGVANFYRRRGNKAGNNLMEWVNEARVAMRSLISPDVILGWQDAMIRSRDIPRGPDGRHAFGQFKDAVGGWGRSLIAAHHKALDSTTAGSGDELVPTFEAAELWMDVNLDTLILPLIPQVAMPTNPFDYPIQFGDTNWYPATENVQITTTTPATQKVTLSAKALKTGVPFSDELEEDAIIGLVPELRSNLVRNAAEVIDDVLLNADTTVTNGINSDGATISATTAGKAHWLIGFDGLRHLCLKDNSANTSIDSNAAIAADLYNRGLSKLGKYGVPRRRGDVVFVVDVNTALRSLSIAEFETTDSGTQSTLSSGEILNVYGIPLIRSGQMRLADTDGLVTNAGNATNTGSILTFNTTQWKVGFRRQIEVEAEREAGKSQTTLYVSFRIALTERSGTRSTATHTSLVFDITGVNT